MLPQDPEQLKAHLEKLRLAAEKEHEEWEKAHAEGRAGSIKASLEYQVALHELIGQVQYK